MHDDDIALIPLRARDGSVKAHAIVDAADAEWVNQWRWCRLPNGYIARTAQGEGVQRTIYLHRALLGLEYGNVLTADHINRNRADNRRANLRAVSRGGNSQNVPSQKGVSRHRGVYLNRSTGKWTAQICLHGRSTHLGTFAEEQDAAEVARAARRRLMPYATD